MSSKEIEDTINEIDAEVKRLNSPSDVKLLHGIPTEELTEGEQKIIDRKIKQNRDLEQDIENYTKSEKGEYYENNDIPEWAK